MGRWPLRGVLVLTALAAACGGAAAPDLVITGARVFTGDAARPWAEAVAIRGERVTAVGDGGAVAPLSGPMTRRIDAGGRVVVPGFNDAHVRVAAPPTPAALQAVAVAAHAQGVTSVQVIAEGRIAPLVDAVRGAGAPLRWRLVRSPARGADGAWIDGKTFVPPQPGPRIDVKGAAWRLAPGALPLADLAVVVPWAYGPEDPIHVDARTPQGVEAYLRAMEATGVAAIWIRKRPRLEFAGALLTPGLPRLRALGVVVVDAAREDGTAAGVRAALDAGLPIALASGGRPASGSTLAWATAGPSALTREAAVAAYTRGSAFAEFAERDKGWIGPGALADLAVLSDDPFAAPADRLPALRSVLTVVGGTVAFDAGVLR